MIASATTTIVEFPNLGWGPWTLRRYLVRDLFGHLSIAIYGAIICVAILIACAVILRFAKKKEGIDTESMLDYFLFCIPIGVIGARVMYVASKWDQYRSFGEMIAIWHGGIAIYGAIIFGALTVLVLARVKKHSLLAVYDSIIPGLLIAQAIGRWGNFVNGEAYGASIVPDLLWGMTVNGYGPVHPTFLYESLITFTGFLLVVFVLYPRKKFNGEIFCFYLMWYGVGRTLVEGLRGDSLMIGPLRLAQCIGVLSAVAGLILLFILALREKKRRMVEAPKETSPAQASAKNKESENQDGADH